MFSYFYMKYLFIFVCFLFWCWFVFSNTQKISVVLNWQWLIIWTPANLDLGTVSSGDIKEINFLEPFWIEDLRWTNTGHYTTIQCDGLYGPNTLTSTVITGVQLSGAVVEKIWWKDNDTLVYSALSSFTDITTPQLYLYRNDSVSNNGAINRYGNKPTIKITVPSWTPAGTYKWKITYTLYDMPFSY